MKTTDLIDLMTLDQQAQTRLMRPLALSAVAAIAASAAMLVLFWGVRPDFIEVISQPLVQVKYLLPLLAALPCLWLASRARHPENSLDGKLRWMLLPLFAIAALVIATLSSLPSSSWWTTIRGETLFACLASIPLLAAPILAGLLWVMQQGAASRPSMAGAAAGLAAGCLAASVYALHCYEDSPAFYGLWYTVAIVLMGVLGQLLGPRVLKW